MSEGNKEEIVQELDGLTNEERAEEWAKWVRAEVNSALDIYLPKALTGHINIRYYPHVVEEQETGPVIDEQLADGVLLSVVFDFEEPIDLTKPRIEEEEITEDKFQE